MGKEIKRITLKDVAEAAGVSAMAVSNVLRGKKGMSKETASRIMKTAKKLGYAPNLIATSLRTDKTNTLGIVMSDSSHMVFSKILAGAESAAAKAGYSIIIANTTPSLESERKVVDVLLNKRIDGLLLAAPRSTGKDTLERLSRFGIPFVLLMRHGDSLPVNSVVNDNFGGGYKAAEYLIKQGDREIFFLSLPKESQSGKERLLGSKKALRTAGLTFIASNLHHAQPNIADGHRAMLRLLKSGVRNGAVCCGCDLIAIGAMQAIFEAGLSVPEDFRICGYDDIEMAEYLRVPLTTIHQPTNDIGRLGVNLLVEKIRDSQTPPRQIVLPNELVVRKTS